MDNNNGKDQSQQSPSSSNKKKSDSMIYPDKQNHNMTSDENKNWKRLFEALQAERVTKAEALFQAHLRETEEREKLMRSYNQELETENQILKAKLSKVPEQLQRQQELEERFKELQSRVSQQEAIIGAYQQLTGTTLSNVRTLRTQDDTTTVNASLECVCNVQNPETKAYTKFQITTVPSTINDANDNNVSKGQQNDAMEVDGSSNDENGGSNTPLMKYQPLENASPLPAFLQEEIEFESNQLPPLLQNVLRGIFPEEDEEEE